MTPELIQLAIYAAQELVKYAPQLATDIGAIFSKQDPTQADWDALFVKVKTYDQYIAPPPA